MCETTDVHVSLVVFYLVEDGRSERGHPIKEGVDHAVTLTHRPRHDPDITLKAL